MPSELASDLARAASVGHQAWIVARERSDFAGFVPYLERNFELVRRYVDCFDNFDCAYDVLLDDYEPGGRTTEVAGLFDELKSELRPLITFVGEHADRVDDSLLHGHFPVDRQRQLVRWLLEQMGFDRSAWRMDDAVHPFATGFSNHDVRITTRWDEGFLPTSVYGAMHECGHGLYEEGVAQSLQRTPLGHAESLALHESQSRLWENMVGRGRPFCGVLAPRIAELFGGPLSDLDGDVLYRAVNRVSPSLIRVEADEVTYGLHIIVRFELEQELVEGRLAIRDLPEAWNARYKEYLGVDVPDDAHGVLQDVHWAAGLIGYFPTYALGNLIAATAVRARIRGSPGPRGADRLRRAPRPARVAARARPPPRLQVFERRAARPAGWRSDRRGSVHRVSEAEARSGVRAGASLTRAADRPRRRGRSSASGTITWR